MQTMPISVYAPNLVYRTDRRESIQEQFMNRPEFEFHLVPAIELKEGAAALWQTFYQIVKAEAAKDSDYFIFCEDDHVFTSAYNVDFLKVQIQKAQSLGAELLSGGMSFVNHVVRVSENLYWVAEFNGMQFTVIFKALYPKILASKTDFGYAVDIHLSAISKQKMVIYPYISVQKEFGYSDATKFNNEEGRVERFFKNTQVQLQKYDKIFRYYSNFPQSVVDQIMHMDVSNVFVPVHVINLKERTDRWQHITQEFLQHPEFKVNRIEAIRAENGAVGLWKSICGIVQKALEADDDYVLICEDDHFFTAHYDRTHFLRQVMLAGAMGAEIFNGGMGGFGQLIPLKQGLHWVDWFWCTQFIVIYKRAYQTILNAHFSVRDVADEKLSKILTSKMAIVPFISEQIDSGYSDVTSANSNNAMILQHFDASRHVLKHYEYAACRYLKKPLDDVTSLCEITSEAYLQSSSIHKLHIGCGNNLLEGWFNTDLKPTYGAAFLDIMQKFPFKADCFDYIYAEHVFDLYPATDVLHVLKECARVLKKNGVLRVVVYSNEQFISMLRNDELTPIQEKYLKWNLSHYCKGKNYLQSMDYVHCKDLALTNFLHRLEKTYVYDARSLKQILNRAGFQQVAIQSLGRSSDVNLKGIEGFKSYTPQNMYEFETLILEARNN